MTVLSPPRAHPRLPSWTRPTRLSALVFSAKAISLRARRAMVDGVSGPAKLSTAADEAFDVLAAQSVTPLWSDEVVAERAFQLGKVQNLRVACRALDGLVIPAGATFSFWRQVGPPIAARGFAPGRMLQQGCMVGSVGGGLCQLSNALYAVALEAGCEIVERHGHSRIVPGSAAAHGRDATVAWNYVDLRFAPTRDLRLTARLDGEWLTVDLRGRPDYAAATARTSAPGGSGPTVTARSCGSCEETDCFLHERSGGGSPVGRRAFLTDAAWPEFQAHVKAERGPQDCLGAPLDGARWGLSRYAWSGEGFARVEHATIAAARRALAQRRAGAFGPGRRAAEAQGARRIAAALARLLTPDITAVTVAQSYLPYLWREGHLGGRKVTVLMSGLPMGVLQARLDAAARAHPDRASLVDFRAPEWLVLAEATALSEAAHVVTPHAEVADLFGERAMRLSWSAPPAVPIVRRPIRRIGFPGPSIARKGAHLVRDAARALDLEVMTLGAELEGDGFWSGVRIIASGDWRGLDAMVQPAMVEDQPRRLIAALAAGVPVIATTACGLPAQSGLTLIAPDDLPALIAALC